MALTAADREEFVVRKMMDQSGSLFTKAGVSIFLARFTIPSDSQIESYLILERDSESQSHYDEVQNNLSVIRNEVPQ